MKTDNIETIAKNNFEKAVQVIEKSGVRQAWQSIGAAVNQASSTAVGLLMKRRDIDLHIYPETRRAILELKYLTPDDQHIMGIEYCQAVIADGVRTYPEFIQWRKNHSANGIVSWCP